MLKCSINCWGEGQGDNREEVTRRMADGYNKEGYQVVQSDSMCFKGTKESTGGPYCERAVNEGYSLLLTRLGVHGI